MYEDCNDWAKEVWGGREFIRRSVVMGEVVALIRQKSETQIKTMERNGRWSPRPYGSMNDKLVPAICWLTLAVDQPLLVQIKSGKTITRLLLVPDAPVVLDENQRARPSDAQLNFMVIERIRVTVGCTVSQAKILKRAVHDKLSLQIFGLAAHLFTLCGYADAKATVEQLWGYSPQQIRTVLPEQFRILAVEDPLHSMKIKAGLNRCIEHLASWQTRT